MSSELTIPSTRKKMVGQKLVLQHVNPSNQGFHHFPSHVTWPAPPLPGKGPEASAGLVGCEVHHGGHLPLPAGSEETSPSLGLHPGRLTWNLQITHLERKMIFQTFMIMFHVNLQGCSCKIFFLPHFGGPNQPTCHFFGGTKNKNPCILPPGTPKNHFLTVVSVG